MLYSEKKFVYILSLRIFEIFYHYKIVISLFATEITSFHYYDNIIK